MVYIKKKKNSQFLKVLTPLLQGGRNWGLFVHHPVAWGQHVC